MTSRSTESPAAVAAAAAATASPTRAATTRRWTAALLALYVLLAAAQWACLAPDSPLMSVLYDEFLYDAMAVEIAQGRPPTMNGAGPPRYPPLYSAALAPVARFGLDRFDLARWLNVIIYTTALFAAFALARRLVGRGPALIAGAAAVLGPGLVLPGHFLSENLYIPLTLFYLLAVVRALEAPSIPRHLLAGVLAAACAWTKVTAVVPVALVGAYLLLGPGLGRRERLHALGWQILACALLTVPLVAHILPGAVRLTAGEAAPAAAIGAGHMVSVGLEHAAAPLWTFGPLFAALAVAALASRLRSRPDRGAHALLVLAALTIAATFVVAAGWIALARPEEARVEERYLLPVYPLLFILAVAAIERPPRGWWWPALFTILAAVTAFAPTYQLDPARMPMWFRQQPGPALLQVAAGEIGLSSARLGLVALWAGLAVAFVWLRRSRWRRIAYAGVLIPGLAFFWLVSGPFRAVQAETDRVARAECRVADALIGRHLQPTERLMFAGEMPGAVPYAVATRRSLRYWYQQSMDPVAWYPGRFEAASGRITWPDGSGHGVLLVTRDGITRGGTLLEAAGPWRAYRLDPREPRLHSFLIPAQEVPPGEAAARAATTTCRIFLWPLPTDTIRTLRATPDGSGVELRMRRWAPYMNTPWLALPAAIESTVPPIQGEEVTVTLIELDLRGGPARFAIEEHRPGPPPAEQRK